MVEITIGTFMKKEFMLAQLRHAYKQLNENSVKDQKQFADGMIAPIIRALEQELKDKK